MKKIKLLAFLLSFTYVFSLTSCGDDMYEPDTPAAKQIEGSYSGTMECSVMGSVDTFENMSFRIVATDDATVTVTLPAFGNVPMAMPSITLEGVKVSETNGIVTIKETEANGMTDTGKKYTVTLMGTVQGNVLNIKLNLLYGSMPMPIICSSTASK